MMQKKASPQTQEENWNEKGLTGYPSIDKPWLKYYSEEIKKRELPLCTAYELLWQSNSSYMDNIALCYFGIDISFRNLFLEIEKTAKSFNALGVGENDIVVMVTATIPETVYALYGLNRIGAIPNMIDPRTSAEGIKEYIIEVNAKYVFVLDVAYDKVAQILYDTSVEYVVIMSPADSLFGIKKKLYTISHYINTSILDSKITCMRWSIFIEHGQTKTSYSVPYAKNRCCLMVHTGGTTGIPKCVMLTNENLNALVLQSIDTGIDMQRTHTWLDIMPPFIAYGFGMGLHLPLVIGMKTFLIPQFNPLKFDHLLIKYKPVHMVGVPSYWETIIKSRKLRHADLSHMISPTVGGDAMLSSLEENVNEFLKAHGCATKITKGYGMTEVCAGVAGTIDKNNEIGSVGIPFSKTIISVFEPNTEHELSYNQIGEICITGPNIMLGYYNNEKATKEIIKIHKDGRAWVHSGDIGYMNKNGSLFIVDRIKKMIVRYDGFKIFPYMIDQTISSHEAVEKSCTVGIKDFNHTHGKLPYSYITLNKCNQESMKKIKQQLFELCKKVLADYSQPVDIEILDKMPLTPIGKVDYRELEKRRK